MKKNIQLLDESVPIDYETKEKERNEKYENWKEKRQKLMRETYVDKKQN